jgi:hypothetical protein
MRVGAAALHAGDARRSLGGRNPRLLIQAKQNLPVDA